jgi:EAL domain-containing protein (putative c-di-GMP-specific phosphodiesterase class I)
MVALGAVSRRLADWFAKLQPMPVDDSTTIKSLPTRIQELALELAAELAGTQVFRSWIHDATGALIWASSDNPTQEERSFVLDALDSFALEPLRPSFEREGSPPRGLVAYAARDPRGALQGALVLDADRRTLAGRTGQRLTQAQFNRLLQQLALHLTGDKPRALPVSTTMEGRPVTLYVQQLLSLRKSGRTRRYEVLLRADTAESSPAEAPRDLLAQAEDPASGGKLDRTVLQQLFGWLAANHAQLQVDPAWFSVNLSTGALLDDSFLEFLEQAIREVRINPRQLGFEIREDQCRRYPAEVTRFLEVCDHTGCHVIIDDFTFHSEVLELLRQRAVRMLKIDASLTVKSLQDKIAQAQISAITHASRMLDMHSVAKRIESPLVRQWLTAIGVDFAQGYLLEGPLPITELASLRLTEPVARR